SWTAGRLRLGVDGSRPPEEGCEGEDLLGLWRRLWRRAERPELLLRRAGVARPKAASGSGGAEEARAAGRGRGEGCPQAAAPGDQQAGLRDARVAAWGLGARGRRPCGSERQAARAANAAGRDGGRSAAAAGARPALRPGGIPERALRDRGADALGCEGASGRMGPAAAAGE